MSFPDWNDRTEICRRQQDRLSSLLKYVQQTNPFWQRKFNEAGLSLQKISDLKDLAVLPLTTKAELVADQNAHPPYGSFQNDSSVRYTRLHQTSGTTGAPLRWLDTADSWSWILNCWGQIYRLIGIRPEDRFCFPFSFGPFLGFWAAFEGAQRQGYLTLAAGGISSSARLKLIRENRVTIVCCTPSYALRLAEVAREEGLDLPQSSVRMLIVAGEAGGSLPQVRQRIEREWGARVIDHWGMTELGPLAVELEETPGYLSLLESECIPEVIDPVTGNPVPLGEVGELVITNLGRLDSPLIRYRTGDLVQLEPPPVGDSCQFLRLRGGILGRSDEMITIRGNNLFPSALEELLRGFPQVAEYRIELCEQRAMNHLRIAVEPVRGSDQLASNLVQQIEESIRERWNFQAEVQLAPVGSLPRFEMKGRRFVRLPQAAEE